MVRWHGGCEEEQNLCRSEATQLMHTYRTPPSAESQWHHWTVHRSYRVLQARHEEWVATGAISQKIQAAYLTTTFITPFRRYCYNKILFGISSAPEHFQWRMRSFREGLTGVLCVMDDILNFGKTKQEHNSRLQAVLKRLSSAGITLDSRKC